MRLDADAREYAHWTITVPTAQGTPAALDVELAGAWVAAALVSDTTVGTDKVSVWRVLVAGPDATPGTATVLPAARTVARIRVTDTPEVVIRPAGAIDIT